MEAAGQLFHLFRDGLDYAFIPHIDESMSWMRGVLFGGRIIFVLVLFVKRGGGMICFPNPSAGSFAVVRH